MLLSVVKVFTSRRISVNRWLDYLMNIWPCTAMKICPIASKIATEG